MMRMIVTKADSVQLSEYSVSNHDNNFELSQSENSEDTDDRNYRGK